MIWNLVFWVALVFLIATVLWRILASRRPKPSSKASGSARSPVDRILGRGWIAPVAAVVVALVALGFIYLPQLIGHNWTDSEREEVDHFNQALLLYQDAITLSKEQGVTRGDWESVNALLQASQSEAEQVGDSVLQIIDPELPSMFREKFIPGLRIGAYSLRFLTSSSKGRDTTETHGDDSLKVGRQLLEEWNTWYAANKSELTSLLE